MNAQRFVYMPIITYKNLISWGKSHGMRPADIARGLEMSTQALNSWRKRDQVAARQADRVAAYMAEADQKAGRIGLKSQIVAIHGKVTRDLTPAHQKLSRAMEKLLGTLTDDQAIHIAELIYKFAGENIANESSPAPRPESIPPDESYNLDDMPRHGVVEGAPERHYYKKNKQ